MSSLRLRLMNKDLEMQMNTNDLILTLQRKKSWYLRSTDPMEEMDQVVKGLSTS